MASIRYILCLMKESKTSSVLLLNYDNETIVESDYVCCKTPYIDS